jgi:hypothetical protein
MNGIRKLAQQPQYQILYARMKDVPQLKLFENTTDLSNLQIEFLYWLETYHQLYQQLAAKEKHLTKKVIEDNIECDAYLYYKDNVKEKDLKEEERRGKPNLSGIPTLVRKPRKKARTK